MKVGKPVPVWIDVLKDAERLCPEAIVLNYTNPQLHRGTIEAENASPGLRIRIAIPFHSAGALNLS